ncbi:MAG: alpha/beta hydrolase [Pseudomonadota bacterium]
MVRRGYVNAGNGQLHYRQAGRRTKDQVPLIALHLVPNSSQVFEVFMEHMSEHRTVIAFDLPGFGMSDGVQEDTIEIYAKVIARGIAELGYTRVDLLGYHTGAAVALELEKLLPESVRFMVLAAIPLLTDEERRRFAALPPIPFDESGDFVKAEWNRSFKWRGPGQSVDSVKRTFAEKMRPGARERGAQAVVRYELKERLASLKKPLLVIRPNDDLWEATLRAKPLLSEAIWVEFPNYGHGLFEVAGPSMADLIQGFLSDPSNSLRQTNL